MSDPILFDNTTPRFGLPNLYPGQAQKEFFINEAAYLTDLFLHPAVEAELGAPPSNPATGQMWLVGEIASGDWQGNEGKIAIREEDGWRFFEPVDGLRLFDKSSQQFLLMSGQWYRATAPTLPTTGITIDTELRSAFTNLIEALRNAGIFSVSG